MFLRVGFELVKGVFLNYLSSWGLLLCCGGNYKMIFMTLLAIDIIKWPIIIVIIITSLLKNRTVLMRNFFKLVKKR